MWVGGWVAALPPPVPPPSSPHHALPHSSTLPSHLSSCQRLLRHAVLPRGRRPLVPLHVEHRHWEGGYAVENTHVLVRLGGSGGALGVAVVRHPQAEPPAALRTYGFVVRAVEQKRHPYEPEARRNGVRRYTPPK